MDQNSSLLPADWEIPAQLRDRLGANAGRQRVLESDGHLILVHHAPPKADETTRRGRFFWRAPDGTWRADTEKVEIDKIARHIAEYRIEIEKLEHAEDHAHGASELFDLMGHVTPLVRSTRHMYETLQVARDIMRDDRELIDARDQAWELTRRTDLLYEDLKNKLDFVVARQAESQAEHSYRLAVAAYKFNLIAIAFFPIVTLMAIFSSNLQHPFSDWETNHRPWPFLALLLIGLCAGLTLMLYFKATVKRPQRDPQSKSSNSLTNRSK